MMDEIFNLFIEKNIWRQSDLPFMLEQNSKLFGETTATPEICVQVAQIILMGGIPCNMQKLYRDTFVKLGYQWEEVYDKHGQLINRIKL